MHVWCERDPLRASRGVCLGLTASARDCRPPDIRGACPRTRVGCRPGNHEGYGVGVEPPGQVESVTSGAPVSLADRSLVRPSPFSQVASEENAASGAVGSSAQSPRGDPGVGAVPGTYSF